MPTGLLLTLLAAKTFTTAVCASSGLVGGKILFLGAMFVKCFLLILTTCLCFSHRYSCTIFVLRWNGWSVIS